MLLVVAPLNGTKLGARTELGMVRVLDAGIGERGLESLGVGPGVLAAPQPAALTHVEEQSDVGPAEGTEKGVDVEPVNPDGGDRPHTKMLAPSCPSHTMCG